MTGLGVLLIDQKVDWYRELIYWKTWKNKLVVVNEQICKDIIFHDDFTYGDINGFFICDRKVSELKLYFLSYGGINNYGLNMDIFNFRRVSVSYDYSTSVAKLPKYYLYSNGDYTKNMNY